MELPKKKPVFNKINKEDINTPSSTIKKAAKTPINTKKPEILLNKNVKGILPTTVLTEEDRQKITKKREKQARLTCALKNISTILSIITVLWFIFMKANISPTNALLSKFGIDKNMGVISLDLEEKNFQLEISSTKIDKKIMDFEKKIKNKYYTLFSEDIAKIRDSQLDWFDKKNKSGETSIGLIDGVRRVAKYFNNNEYQDPNNIISGRHEKIEINNISATRKTISFSAATTQILGRIIFMDIEFIDVLNSFPIYKNGKHLNSFSRDKNDDGDYSTEFAMSLDVQKFGEEDNNDDRFAEYLKWLKNKNPQVKIINYKNTNK